MAVAVAVIVPPSLDRSSSSVPDRRALLDECRSTFTMIVGQLEHALPQPFYAAACLGIDVGARVQHQLGHAYRERGERADALGQCERSGDRFTSRAGLRRRAA